MRFAFLVSILAVFVACIAAASPALTQDQRQFVDFVTRFDKKYPTTEVLSRFQAFTKNLRAIEAHNALASTSKLTVTERADVTAKERAVVARDSIMSKPTRSTPPSTLPRGYPQRWDWREHDGVARVKKMGECLAASSFAATALMEFALSKKIGAILPLSEGQLVDCAYPHYGCDDLPIEAPLDYLYRTALCEEQDYPWGGRVKPSICKDTECEGTVRATRPFYFNGTNDEDLVKAVSRGVVAVRLATNNKMVYYLEGVYDAEDCAGVRDMDVVAVGYDLTAPEPYITVKLPWGTSFGEKGYMRLAYGKNMCGVSQEFLTVNPQ